MFAVDLRTVLLFILILSQSERTEVSGEDSVDQTCISSFCPKIYANTVTNKDCSDGFNVGSKCTFTCPKLYGLIGESTITCMESNSRSCHLSEWSSRIPFCRALFCSDPPVIDNAIATCTRENKVGSLCTYNCIAGFKMVPAEGHSGYLCYKTGEWVADFKPCCIRDFGDCPPNLKADIAFVFDSSSSLRDEDFKMITRFFKEVVSYFNYGPQDAKFAVVRYNRDVYAEIQLNSFQYKEGFLNALDQISRSGFGTRTGQALQFTLDVVLDVENGDRPDFPNVVFLFTDGISQDLIEPAAESARGLGVQIFLLVIGDRYAYETISFLTQGDNHNAFLFYSYEELGLFGASRVANRLCLYRCTL